MERRIGNDLFAVRPLKAEETGAAYHRRGVGTGLFERLREDFPGALTVNSSPFGLPFYERLGFTALSGEQTVNGIRFTPMALWKASHRKSSYIRRNTT